MDIKVDKYIEYTVDRETLELIHDLAEERVLDIHDNWSHIGTYDDCLDAQCVAVKSLSNRLYCWSDSEI